MVEPLCIRCKKEKALIDVDLEKCFVYLNILCKKCIEEKVERGIKYKKMSAEEWNSICLRSSLNAKLLHISLEKRKK